MRLFTDASATFLSVMASMERSAETIRSYKEHYKVFVKHVEAVYNGPIYVEELTVGDVEQHLMWLKDTRHYAASSRSHVLHALRSFFQYAVQHGWVKENPAAMLPPIRVQRKERHYLTASEMEALLDTLEQPLVKLVAWFLFHTGLRITECLNLTLETVDFSRRHIHVVGGKGNKDRVIPMSDAVYTRLRRYVEQERPDVSTSFFFATKASGKLTRTTVNQPLNAAARKLGWTRPVTAHVLRHSFASQLLKRGVGLMEVQKLLGHSSLTVTSLYTHTCLDDLQTAVNTLGGGIQDAQ